MAKITGTVFGKWNGEEVYCYVSANTVHDPNFGADADGNRGVPIDLIEDITLDEAWYTPTPNGETNDDATVPESRLSEVTYDEDAINWDDEADYEN